MENETTLVKQTEKLHEETTELKSKVDILNIKIDNMSVTLTDLKQGMAARVEKHGEDIAILKENIKTYVDVKEFATIKEKIDSLETTNKLTVGSIVGSYFINLWMLFKK